MKWRVLWLWAASLTVSGTPSDLYADDDNFVAPDAVLQEGAETGFFSRRKKQTTAAAEGAVRGALAREKEQWLKKTRFLEPRELLQVCQKTERGMLAYTWEVDESSVAAVPSAASLVTNKTTVTFLKAAGVAIVACGPLTEVTLRADRQLSCLGCLAKKTMERGETAFFVLTTPRILTPTLVSLEGVHKDTKTTLSLRLSKKQETSRSCFGGSRIAWLSDDEEQEEVLTPSESRVLAMHGSGGLRLELARYELTRDDGRDGGALDIFTRVYSPSAELLSAPARLVFEGADCTWRRVRDELLLGETRATWRWRAESSCGSIDFEAQILLDEARVLTTFEVSGGEFKVSIRAALVEEAAPYISGLGLRAGRRPLARDWRWAASRPLDGVKGAPPGMGAVGSTWDQFAWLGSVDVGLKLRLMTDREGDDDGAQLNWKLAPSEWPEAWRSGGISVSREAVLEAYTGALKGTHRLRSSWTLTPFHAPRDASRIFGRAMRRYHSQSWEPPDCQVLAGAGVASLTLHHGGRLNPYINYPFHASTTLKLRAFSQRCAKLNIDVSIYYTHREISVHADELPLATALYNRTLATSSRPNLANEKFAALDHRLNNIPADVVRAWSTDMRGGETPHGGPDLALAVTARSAWSNFYARGAGYLAQCAFVRGLYLDGIAMPPSVLARTRRNFRRGGFDLHAANKTSVYLELYPHFDSVWTGEASDYGADQAHFLVGIAGAPFGLPSQMLSGMVRRDPGLYYRGLLFGMTDRAGWFPDPKGSNIQRLSALWNLFDLLDLAHSKITGSLWGSTRSSIDVSCSSPDVAVSVFHRESVGALVVIASWSPRQHQCTVSCSSFILEPQIPALQCGSTTVFRERATFTVEPDSGLVLIVGEREPLLAAMAEAGLVRTAQGCPHPPVKMPGKRKQQPPMRRPGGGAAARQRPPPAPHARTLLP